mmetsp:Transcript_16452/g.29727  ORF Transcript_16452/g.29727 Transcript_16452/m.29727 type:complete len:309 (-) Transcript_16452:58-984(-)|eukprot:CAMPEP_0201608126 /NCGR_PEP_ID=MMETSP0492-20130828/6997_1 /ASSEMBLY_ACC=CAM_ASM_000837 /TAXON_ID=420259 /ORGANISM="Thalassiosira gravida, Strain GMp14c1" /LENGTH=308 /DNA_ID=CAMNT_0048072835 /DNA_START=191 /DNA_END=1117 /DNA_ORIENTATION=+
MKSIYSLLLPVTAVAFSSIPADPSYPSSSLNTNNDKTGNNNNMPRPIESTSDHPFYDVDATSSPWRIALDIGREPLARMPFEWARTGCRMPLVIPTDFAINDKNASKNKSILAPHSDTVSFTGPNGAVIRPIIGEGWELSKDERTLSFSYTVPEELKRRDVYIEAGSTLVMTGRVYSKKELDRLNADYYQAREELWEAGGELGDIYDRASASKRWDEESGSWVKRYDNENPFKVAQKQLFYWGAKAKQGRKMAERPDLNELSDRGNLPGVDGGVYIAKEGVVRVGKDGPVCGKWSARPITGAPASYRS